MDAAAAAVDDDAAAPTLSFVILAAAVAWPSDEHAVVAARTAETSKPADACSDPWARTATAAETRVSCVAIPEDALLHPLLDVVAAERWDERQGIRTHGSATRLVLQQVLVDGTGAAHVV